MSKLILTRHGQSVWNEENRFTGWVDVDLSNKGVAEAQKSGQLIKLPKNELKENLNLLILIFKNNNFKGIETIDLRQHGQVITNG